MFAQGDRTGYGFHGDYVNAWDVNVLQKALETCVDARCDNTFSRFTDAEMKSCETSASVNDAIDGSLKALPGCNPITSGPAPANPAPIC